MNNNDDGDDDLVFDNRTLTQRIYKSLQLNEQNEKDNLQFLTVRKPNEKDKFLTISKNNYQADLVSLPNDNGYRYFLLVVNIWNRKLDAEPLKTKTAGETLQALVEIINRHIIDKPQFLLTDHGAEFNNDTWKAYCTANGINLAFASVQRKNAMAIVEYYNGLVGKYLYTKMGVESIKHHIRNRTWVRYLKDVIKEINKWNSTRYPKKTIKDIIDMEVPINKLSDLIPLGTWVYPKLFKPMDLIEGRHLYGKFRSGDIRYNNLFPTRVTTYLINVGRPIRYVLDGITDTSFTKSELIIERDQNRLNQHPPQDPNDNNNNNNDDDDDNGYDYHDRHEMRQFPEATIQRLAQNIVSSGPASRPASTGMRLRTRPQSTYDNLSASTGH